LNFIEQIIFKQYDVFVDFQANMRIWVTHPTGDNQTSIAHTLLAFIVINITLKPATQHI